MRTPLLQSSLRTPLLPLARTLSAALLALTAGCAATYPEASLPLDKPSIEASDPERDPAPRTPLLPAAAAAPEPPRPASPLIPFEPPPFAAAPRPNRTFLSPTVPREQTRAVVLAYHLFGNIQSPLAVETERFDEQLRWLVENRVDIITAAELSSFLDGDLLLPERVAVVTLDDGHSTVYARAYPLLKKHHIRFTLALNTEAIEGRRPEAVTWANVNEMLASGLCEIASHSHIHGHMDRLTEASNRREVSLSRDILEARTGVRPEVFVFPFGGHTPRVRELVREAGYRAAFTVGGPAVTGGSPRFHLPRAGVFKTTTMGAFAGFFGGARPAPSALTAPRSPSNPA